MANYGFLIAKKSELIIKSFRMQPENIMLDTINHKGDLRMTEAILFKDKIEKLCQPDSVLEVNLTESKKSDLVGVNSLVMLHLIYGRNNSEIHYTIKRDSELDELLQMTKFDEILHLTYED